MAALAASEALVGLVPLALTGGIVLGFTQEAFRIPSRLRGEEYEYRRPRRRSKRTIRVEGDDVLQRLFGSP